MVILMALMIAAWRLRTCSNEPLLPCLRPIVNIAIARFVSETIPPASSNQQLAGREIPVVAIADGDGAIDTSRCHIGQTQLKGQVAAEIARRPPTMRGCSSPCGCRRSGFQPGYPNREFAEVAELRKAPRPAMAV